MAITDERMVVLDDIPSGVRVKFDVLGVPVEGQVLYHDEAYGLPVVDMSDGHFSHKFPWGFRKQTRVIEIIE